MEYRIPRKTLERLEGPLFEGNRHDTIIKVAFPLIGDGVPDEEIFRLIRDKMPKDKSDYEIWKAIRWCKSRSPQPTKYKTMDNLVYKSDLVTRDQAVHNAKSFVKDLKIDEEAVSRKSKVPIPEDLQKHATTLFSTLYEPSEFINIITKFMQPDGKPNKACPMGSGKTMTRDAWIEYFETRTPFSQAGAWMRPNPVKEVGTGKDGAIQDQDVTAYRFLLVESDCVPVDVQLSMICKLRLPVAAIISSGGSSYHAWIKLNAEDDASYRSQSERIFSALKRFGIDAANKNPSRLARLPGAVRVIGANNGGEQRLIYLNPNPEAKSIL